MPSCEPDDDASSNPEILNIEPSDLLSRCIIFDRHFQGDLHVDKLLWRFLATGDDGRYHESAVLRRIANTDDDVHKIGCGIASMQNNRRKKPTPQNQRFYCGFRNAEVKTIALAGDGFQALLTHCPEGDVYAHVDVAIEILIEPTKENRSQRDLKLAEVGLILAEAFGWPVSHRCPCDRAEKMHPFTRFGEDCLTRGLTLPADHQTAVGSRLLSPP